MKRVALYIILVICTISACEQEFIPKGSLLPQEIVVEGYIEAGEIDLPAYVLITQSQPFFSTISQQQFDDLFINDAVVTVDDGDQIVTLEEICLFDLPKELQGPIAEQFGFDPDSLVVNICVYIDVLDKINREIGRSYTLNIHVNDLQLTAITTIPTHVPLDSLRFFGPPGEPNDTLAQLLVSVSDPPNEANFYKYFASINNGPFNSGFQSVTNDIFFNGKSFEFQLQKPETGSGEIDPLTFGLYHVGDTVAIKWANLDEGHFNFWNTLEFSNANQGPFSSYTRIESNIEGGLGIWGGYSISIYKIIVRY